MNITIDKFIQTGFKHSICEDAVLTGNSPFPYLIVADGCSSSEETHIGSNILAKAAEFILTTKINHYNYIDSDNIAMNMAQDIIDRAWFVAQHIPLEKSALDSTLMMSWVIADELYYIVFGDGIVHYQYNNQSVFLNHEQADNMPDYLSYFLDRDRMQAYHERASLELKDITMSNGDICTKNHEKHFEYEIKKMPIDQLKYFILSTDGLASFFDGSKYISLEEIGIQDFKKLNGDFLERRVKRIIKINTKNHIFHHDDLGMAGMSFEPIDENQKESNNE